MHVIINFWIHNSRQAFLPGIFQAHEDKGQDSHRAGWFPPLSPSFSPTPWSPNLPEPHRQWATVVPTNTWTQASKHPQSQRQAEKTMRRLSARDPARKSESTLAVKFFPSLSSVMLLPLVSSRSFYYFILSINLGAGDTPSVLRAYSGLCTMGSLLVVLMWPDVVLGVKPGLDICKGSALPTCTTSIVLASSCHLWTIMISQVKGLSSAYFPGFLFSLGLGRRGAKAKGLLHMRHAHATEPHPWPPDLALQAALWERHQNNPSRIKNKQPEARETVQRVGHRPAHSLPMFNL